MNDARATILERIRAELGPRRPPPAAREPYRAAGVPVPARIERFRSALERVGGHLHVARDERDALEVVRGVLTGAGARSLIVSDAPLATGIARALPPGMAALSPREPRERLLAADAGLTAAQWGIAETGTLVLESHAEQHRLASLLPPLHVALLPAARLLGTIGDALDATRGPDGSPAARTVTFVTGPSRTADIELELVVGVHGPKHLHLVLLTE